MKISQGPVQEKETPLMNAVRNQDVSAVCGFLEDGAAINGKSTNGSSPLLLAVVKGNVDMVKLLIDHSADVNISGPEKWTPLHAACFLGHIDIVQLLLQNNADTKALRFFNSTWRCVLSVSPRMQTPSDFQLAAEF